MATAIIEDELSAFEMRPCLNDLLRVLGDRFLKSRMQVCFFGRGGLKVKLDGRVIGVIKEGQAINPRS